MTATTYSDHFPVADERGMPLGTPGGASERARVGPGPRASLATTERDGKILAAVKRASLAVASDIRSAWWAPASLPAVQRAWAERMPDRARVPGDNGPLYGGWVVYNHAVALPSIVAITCLVGALGVAAWLIFHPARFVLTAIISTALAGLIFG